MLFARLAGVAARANAYQALKPTTTADETENE